MNVTPRMRATFEALLVTLLWSSSYVLTKIGLSDVPPLTLVGFRYLIASLILLPIAIRKGEHRTISRNSWWKLGLLGLLGYTIAQGLQCVGLYYLPSVSVTLILNFTPILVLVLNRVVSGGIPRKDQLAGMTLVLLAASLFFRDQIIEYNLQGFVFTFISGIGWAGYMVAGKILFKSTEVSALGNTAFSMAMGTALLSSSAYFIEGVRLISIPGWLIIIWLGVVNTALAFFLWNHALETLEAFELSVLQNTMLIQITILSFLFLGETFHPVKYIYLALVFIGVYIVQSRKVPGTVYARR
jgi:drug/metabolite transporter (DMT)-like permease